MYFNEEVVSPATHDAINREVVDLCKQWLILDSGNWKRHNMDEVCPLIKEWRTTNLKLCKYACDLDENSLPKILRQIKEVKFPNLQDIFLIGNLIESVEGLNRIHLPKLENLFISTSSNI